ncbi:nucleolin-like [Solea solea]|uniref:nucleolin-like n=1 Tax=Solea solea TaxID=90069 RepID=UPI00272C3766|nr:nucleolin-like [Solea solea]
MAKKHAPTRSKRKVVTDDAAEEPGTEGQTEMDCLSEQVMGEGAAIESAEIKEEEKNQVEQDSQMDCVIEVKGSIPTVTVSWAKTDADSERVSPNDQSGEQTLSASSVDDIGCIDKTPGEISEITTEDTKEKQVIGKRKADLDVKTCPSKKTKLINDGYCLFVGNLNNSKKYNEVKDSLASYFMAQSLLFQDIRLDRSKKHAYVDLASELDLTKGLTLNGESVLDKPMKIAKAKVKNVDQVKEKTSQEKKAAKNARCLFLKNLPYSAKKEDIMKIFKKAINVRFPGQAEVPSHGIAFVEFKDEFTAKKMCKHNQGAKFQGRDLIVDFVGERTDIKATKTNDKPQKNAAAPPNNILFVSNLSCSVKEKLLNKIFQKAANIRMPQSQGKPKGFAFVEFASVADAENALQSTKNVKIHKRAIRVQFFEEREKPQKAKVDVNTLILSSLSEKTTAETLKSAFEGACSARVAVDKETGVSKKFGFVVFESEEHCKAARKAMEDCEIDGSKVTVGYARAKPEKSHHHGAGGGMAGQRGGQNAGQGAGKGVNSSRRGKKRGAGLKQDAAKEVKNKV